MQFQKWAPRRPKDNWEWARRFRKRKEGVTRWLALQSVASNGGRLLTASNETGIFGLAGAIGNPISGHNICSLDAD